MTWWRKNGERFNIERLKGERLNEEMQAHIDFETQDNIEAGMPPEAARQAAMRKFGNVLLAREKSREIWGWLWAERLWQDIRYALRGLRKNSGFSAVAILSLALGIGATTSMFSLIYAVLLHPVRYADWQRIAYPIYLNDDQPTSPERWFSVSWAQYQQMLKAGTVQDVVGDDNTSSETTGHDIPEEVTLTYITENVGRFLGVPALLGRNIQPSDADDAQRQAPVVLSYDFWMRHYNGDRSVLGKILELDHKPYIIVGVVPKDYTFSLSDVYAPMSLLPTRDRYVQPIMKLKPGVSLTSADAEFDALVHQFAKETPQRFSSHFRMHLEHVTDGIVTIVGHTLALLFAAVVMLLTIGCANCSILLLARGRAVRPNSPFVPHWARAGNASLAN